ncbi:putative ATP-dependent helicase 25 [Liparis tanakae]|uniref:Putative ATP-dependent helicase 25 n=1 Tax=Liparis tanakae TaxID=230148 RepID=A0A4Z2IJM4_9TELE|nr:putative ATP-dependent helicase 25 [Liparis tanakae]
MNLGLLERMLRCLALFYGPGKGPLAVFSGSVSQLQPVGSNLHIWESESFEGLLSSSTQLFVNKRQFEDPGYAEALTYLQFNTVTKESMQIFRSQMSVCERDVMDPDYEPEKLRIFHQDKQQIVHERDDKEEGPRRGKVSQRGSERGVVHRTEGLGSATTERDYLKVDKLWVGCRVRMIWHADINGIQVAANKTVWSSSALPVGQRNLRQQLPSAADTEGVVQGIRFKRESQFNEFYV